MTEDARILCYFAGPIAGYWGIWALRGLADRTASEEECRRGALIVGLLAALPLVLGVRARPAWAAVTIVTGVCILYSLLIARLGAMLRAYVGGEGSGQPPSMPGLAVRALVYPVIAFVAGMAASAGAERLGAADPVLVPFPILQLLAVARLVTLARRAGRGYWMLLPAAAVLTATLLFAVIGVPIG